jgi:orotate phosphoribosyltransferase
MDDGEFAKNRIELGLMLLKHSYRNGIFTLTSGKESDFYIDCKPTILIPWGSCLVGGCFAHIISNASRVVEAVAGVTLGADPLLTATSIMGLQWGLDLPQIIIRKEPKSHGTGKQLEEAGTVLRNSSVALLDDVLTTGGTTLNVGIRALENDGHKVKIILLVVDREEGGREFLAENGYNNVHSIFTKTELLALR